MSSGIPEDTAVYRLVQEHLETVLAQVELETGSGLPEFVKEAIEHREGDRQSMTRNIYRMALRCAMLLQRDPLKQIFPEFLLIWDTCISPRSG